MRPAYVVEITTPKKYQLRGLWFGPKKPKRIVVWVHGLGGTAFSMRSVIDAVVDAKTAVLAFNNRGHGVLSKISSAKKKGKSLDGGAAQENFVDCVDDIQGAINFVKRQGEKHVYLAGHSTGCQKSTYWAYKTDGGRRVKGIILLAPISDWAAETKRKGKKRIAHTAAAARALISRGKKHSLLPEGLWHEVLDAQRFLSLYTPDSPEEIFSYAQPQKNPRVLKSVTVPILTLWAEKDEYSDRKSQVVQNWFEEKIVNKGSQFIIVPSTGHGFKGKEFQVAHSIHRWMDSKK